MNPYLEQEEVWHDFHERFIPHIAEALLPQVRPNYIVKLDEHAYIHELPANERRLLGRADVAVATLGDALRAPNLFPPPPMRRHTRWCRWRSMLSDTVMSRSAIARLRDLVTIIELLSPSNKRPGGDREQYLAKRDAFLASGVHFVELDLLRGGPRLPVEPLPPCDYYAMVSRSEERPRVGVWPISLRDPLPTIPVPLRSPDSDVRLDLQQLVHEVYEKAGYEDYIYGSEPQPPLIAEDRAWRPAFRASASGIATSRSFYGHSASISSFSSERWQRDSRSQAEEHSSVIVSPARTSSASAAIFARFSRCSSR